MKFFVALEGLKISNLEYMFTSLVNLSLFVLVYAVEVAVAFYIVLR